MIERFYRLRHYTVIGSNHQYNDIGNLGTSCTHHRKGFVPRCIQEGDISFRRRHHISTDMLRNAAEFLSGNISASNSIKRFCLTVINMSHNGNNRRSNYQRGIFVTIGFDDGFVIQTDNLDIAIIFRCENRGGIGINGLVHCNHHTHLHQFTDQFGRFQIHFSRQFRNGN